MSEDMKMELAVDLKALEESNVGHFADVRLKKQERSSTIGLYRSRPFV